MILIVLALHHKIGAAVTFVETEDNILTLFDNLLNEIKNVVKYGYIHGNLSEYNIQYIKTASNQPNRISTRDVNYILNYF